MALASPAFAFVAGLLSITSPCILPLLPVVVGSAASRHRLGPAALAAGIALSFLLLGLFVATLGFAVGLDAEAFRAGAAVLLATLGATLIVPRLQAWLSRAAAPLAALAQRRLDGVAHAGLPGQFAIGLLLGAVWTPCAGPTLGAAALVASQGRDLVAAALTMSLFAIGAVLPLIGVGLLSRGLLLRWRGRLLAMGRAGKAGLGVAMIAFGVAIFGGYDRSLESALLDIAPDWFTRLSTAF
jgi:cytochrome c biogenesis protein CcdA